MTTKHDAQLAKVIHTCSILLSISVICFSYSRVILCPRYTITGNFLHRQYQLSMFRLVINIVLLMFILRPVSIILLFKYWIILIWCRMMSSAKRFVHFCPSMLTSLHSYYSSQKMFSYVNVNNSRHVQSPCCITILINLSVCSAVLV